MDHLLSKEHLLNLLNRTSLWLFCLVLRGQTLKTSFLLMEERRDEQAYFIVLCPLKTG